MGHTKISRDSWGFSEADHEELRALMTKHHERAMHVLVELAMTGGVKPDRDDPGMMGWLAQAVPEVNMRVFPSGGLWRTLLEELRAIDQQKGGAR